MASFSRSDYERLISMSRRLMALGRTSGQGKTKHREMKKIARELFTMTENVLGQQIPPIDEEHGFT